MRYCLCDLFHTYLTGEIVTVKECSFVVISSYFFFKQNTAYEMRISDWSSDVCSSDLAHAEMPDHAVVRIERDDQILAAPRNRLNAPPLGLARQIVRHRPAQPRVTHRDLTDTPTPQMRFEAASDGRSEEHTSELHH